MSSKDSHLSDQELLLAADGELPSAYAAQADLHLAICETCRIRKTDIEETLADFVQAHRAHLDPLLPSAVGPRALLRAELAQLASAPKRRLDGWFSNLTLRYTGAPLLVASLALLIYFRPGLPSGEAFSHVPFSFPETGLTPGATVAMNRDQLCLLAPPKNRMVAASLRRKVFQEYGIAGAAARSYEVDYLITPALGGADDIRNLWPQSYTSAVWNAGVKDELEDRLHDLVCEGKLDLATAQKDISSDWIAAYMKYFNTDRPVESAR
ncbi:MAG: hypothetical protein ABI833_12475 [Acidobacteriota bacterium]